MMFSFAAFWMETNMLTNSWYKLLPFSASQSYYWQMDIKLVSNIIKYS